MTNANSSQNHILKGKTLLQSPSLS